MADLDWQLTTCCDTNEIIFLCFYCGYIVISLLLYNTFLLKPMRLLSVFVHEFGHASACWMTGGKVSGIEVYNNEGGVTKFQGGVRLVVIPAGYVGSTYLSVYVCLCLVLFVDSGIDVIDGLYVFQSTH